MKPATPGTTGTTGTTATSVDTRLGGWRQQMKPAAPGTTATPVDARLDGWRLLSLGRRVVVLCREEARGGADSQRQEDHFSFHMFLSVTVFTGTHCPHRLDATISSWVLIELPCAFGHWSSGDSLSW